MACLDVIEFQAQHSSSATTHKVNKQTKHFLMSSSHFALQKMTSYKIHPSFVIYR